MPWLVCTTGSPTCSSDKSLINASTSLTASWRRRRRRAGVAAKSSVSVMNVIDGASSRFHTKPRASGVAAIATGSSLPSNSASADTLGTWMRWSRSSSSRLSRRPSLSAINSTRVVCESIRPPSAASGSCEPRSTLTSGAGAAHAWAATASAPVGGRSARVACAPVSAKNSSARRKIASGGRIGRSGSCCRKRWRSRVSAQKRPIAASRSPCNTSAAGTGCPLALAARSLSPAGSAEPWDGPTVPPPR